MLLFAAALILSGLALLFSKNERLEECYEPLPGSEPLAPG
jgi:hypothetical protein